MNTIFILFFSVFLTLPAQSASVLIRAFSDADTVVPEWRTQVECKIYTDGRVERTFREAENATAEQGWEINRTNEFELSKNNLEMINELLTDASIGEILSSDNACDVGTVSVMAYPEQKSTFPLFSANDCGKIEINQSREAVKLVRYVGKVCDFSINFFRLDL